MGKCEFRIYWRGKNVYERRRNISNSLSECRTDNIRDECDSSSFRRLSHSTEWSNSFRSISLVLNCPHTHCIHELLSSLSRPHSTYCRFTGSDFNDFKRVNQTELINEILSKIARCNLMPLIQFSFCVSKQSRMICIQFRSRRCFWVDRSRNWINEMLNEQSTAQIANWKRSKQLSQLEFRVSFFY